MYVYKASLSYVYILMCSIKLFFMDSPKVSVYPAYGCIFKNGELENSKIESLFYIINKDSQWEHVTLRRLWSIQMSALIVQDGSISWDLFFHCSLLLVSKVNKTMHIVIEKLKMLLVPWPAHSLLSATTPVLPCCKEQSGPGPHARSSCLVLTHNLHLSDWHDLGVTLDTLFSSYSISSQVLSILPTNAAEIYTTPSSLRPYPSLSYESLLLRLPAAILPPEPSSTPQPRQSP